MFIQWNITQHKKEQNNATYSNIDGLRDYHTKWSKPDRKTSYDLYVKSKKKKKRYKRTYLQSRNKPTGRKQTDSYQKGKGWGRDKLGVWD